MKAIIGGRILTVTGSTIDDGVVLVDDGKIVGVGSRGSIKIPKDAEVIDVTGKYVAPGFIDAHSHLGVIPEGLDWEYSDVNDYYSPVTPHLRAIDVIDPYDVGFKDAIEGGVTIVHIGPGSANVIGGIGAIIRTYGRNLNDMILNPESTVKMAIGPKRPREYKSKMPYPITRMGSVSMLKSWLIKAKDYIEGRVDRDKIDTEERLMLDILAKVLKGEMPAKIHLSSSPDEIYAIVRVIEEFKLKATIDHVFGGHLVADLLASKNINVVYGPPMISRVSALFRYATDEAPVVMYRKGVKVSIMSDHPVIPQKHLRLLAAVTVRNGLSLDEALELITINPAKALGLEDRVGSIEAGKDANLVISDDHPVKPSSKIEMVLINGEIVYSIH